ncbi:nicotinate-nucleotide adenylyltransferase [Halobacillus yeomjeoni]|uniref:Probable nicotinate-nucleotide adenylyltransferase n=1 Tax=Halobacillus yeomjeoni TaxID=311194 RepID=A0A931HUX2_9BACI|nr:nicotinate-nucleotide adenylyltransferase [Halobacillus yeomjeoni]MBH0229943.1 nicotinate-nucleotide adenylyltransferase [Halobacillus yeomjeoni]
MKRIGILGGTFDPPHQGHLVMAEFVRDQMVLDEVWFIPSHDPPHKEGAVVPSEARLEMVEIAVANNPFFKVCDIELKRKGTSYTIDTIKELNDLYADDEFYFIIGGDMVEHLPKWHRIEELKRIVKFVGVKRPGYEWKPEIPVESVEIPLLDISSTYIRSKVGRNESVRYLVPDLVNDFIKERGLYGFES